MEVCIIGGGWLSISAAKVCLENDCKPTILCRDSSFGGLYQGLRDRVGVWESMNLNTNKYQSAFTDMLWDSEDPIFPSAKQLLRYFSKYIDKHNLLPYFSFNSEVTSLIREGQDYKVSWTSQGQAYDKIFSHVIIAVGRCSKDVFTLNSPEIYKGDIIFGSRYREPSVFAGKSVLCIGRSYTSSDIAYEALSTASSVTLLYARKYMLARKMYKEIPSEFIFSNLSVIGKQNSLITSLESNKNITKFLEDHYGNPSQYADEWEVDVENQDDFIRLAIYNDGFLSSLKNKEIQLINGKAVGFYENGVVLEDGRKIETQAVLLGMGYNTDYSFLSDEIKEIIRYDENDCLLAACLYRSLIHPLLPRLAFIGYFLSTTPGRYELSAEIGVKYVIGKLEIPEEELWQGVRDDEFIRENSRKVGVPYSHNAYMKEQMRILGIKLDMEFINNELKFGKGPILPQFFFLERPGMKDLCRTVVREIKEKFPMYNFED